MIFVNYYEILALPQTATLKQIKDAFKKQAVLYHPDKNPDNKQAEEKFKTINEAYQILSNTAKRELFDQKLAYDHFNNQQRTQKREQRTENREERTEKKEQRTERKEQRASSHEYRATNTEYRTTNTEDFSTQGKHYSGPYYDHSKRSSLNYVIAFTIIFIIATGALLFGFMMNNIAAQEHYKAAVLHYETENYTKALQELNKAVEFNEKYGEAYLLRAQIKYQFSKYESALPDFNLAMKYIENPPANITKFRDVCREEVAKKRLEDTQD